VVKQAAGGTTWFDRPRALGGEVVKARQATVDPGKLAQQLRAQVLGAEIETVAGEELAPARRREPLADRAYLVDQRHGVSPPTARDVASASQLATAVCSSGSRPSM